MQQSQKRKKKYVYIYKTIINSYSPGNGASQVALVVKNPPANAGDIRDTRPIPGSGRHTGLGNGNSLQYSCLDNPMSRGAWWATFHGVAKSRTRLSIPGNGSEGARGKERNILKLYILFVLFS